MKFTLLLFLAFIFLFEHAETQDSLCVPAFKEVISLKGAGTPVISPDDSEVLFSVRQPDWDNNRFDNEIWLSRNGKEAFQLTDNPDGSSYDARWSPDPLINTFFKSDISVLDVESIEISSLVSKPSAYGLIPGHPIAGIFFIA